MEQKAGELPDGRIKTAITGGMKETLKWTYPVIFVLWAIIFLAPWAAWFGSPGEPPLALGAVQKLMNLGSAPFPWVSILITLFMAALAAVMVEGAKLNLEDPAGNPVFAPLIEAGTDLVEAVREFEEAVAAGTFEQRGVAIATPAWLFINRADMALIPVSSIAWMYLRRSISDAAVTGAFKAAGVISSHQARLAEDFADTDVLVIHAHDRQQTVEFTCDPGTARELLAYLLTSNPVIVAGWSKALKTLWNEDRSSFAQSARAHLTTQDKARTRSNKQDAPISDIIDQAASMLDRLRE